MPFHRRSKRMQILTNKTFDQQSTSRAQQFDGGREGNLVQFETARRVRITDAAQFRREIGQYAICRTAQQLFDFLPHVVTGHVALQQDNVTFLKRLNRLQVHSDDLAAVSDNFGGDLKPAARGSAEIDDGIARMEKTVTLLQLKQLVSRTGAITLLLRFFVVAIMVIVSHKNWILTCSWAKKKPDLQRSGLIS